MSIEKLAIAVTFHYREERIKYLEKISTQFDTLAQVVSVYILTNEADNDKKSNILRCVKQSSNFFVEIHTPTYLGHPKLLTWSHFCIFKRLLYTDPSITHFMYLEDDIFVTRTNIEYWMKARRELKSMKVIPSFLRFENKPCSLQLYSTDCTKKYSFYRLPKFKLSEDYYYINLPEPYQGMYLLDRELMTEHLHGPSSIPEYTPWGISEKAAAGLTFMNVPNGCYSRNFVGYEAKEKRIDPSCLVHHLPNNYSEDLNSPHGKIKIDELVAFSFFSVIISKLLDHPIFPKIILRLMGRRRQKM